MSKEPNKGRAEAVFKQLSGAIKGFITKNISSSIEAEDMLHDVFYKFIITDGEDQIINNVSSWLYRVTRNQIIDRSRKIKEQRMPQYVELTAEDKSYLSDPERNVIDSMVKEELEEALKELPHEQRSVFELNEIQGISFKEISENSGIPINTLISRKHYATQHLRRKLASHYNIL